MSLPTEFCLKRGQAETFILEMEAVAKHSRDSLEEFLDNPIESEASSKTGAHYSISIAVSKRMDSIYLLEGNIHNNDSFKFELLEERMVIQK